MGLGGVDKILVVWLSVCQFWQKTGRTGKLAERPVSRFVPTPPRPIHRWKALGETVTTVIVHGGVLYYNLSYGGYTPKSQLAAIKPLFLSVTMMYVCTCNVLCREAVRMRFMSTTIIF
eukprot:COSAG01_NODE_3485_length_6019_cov_5.932939_5_plen_118_part_00